MRMSKEEFCQWEHKAVTLLGMSGVGKTTLANRLPKTEWFHYSGDYRIGTKYLEEPILDNIKRQAMKVDFLRDLLRSDSIYICSNITVHNLAPISTFLGKIGNPAQGGLDVAQFKERQRLHREAEIGAMRDVASFIKKANEIYGYPHFLNDAGGSVCELNDPTTIDVLAQSTVILYLRADAEMEQELVRRAVEDPKPLYYDAPFLDARLTEYLSENELDDTSRIDPDAFVQWMFPKLVDHRRPLYEKLSRDHGYGINAREVETVRDEQDFVALVGGAIAAG